MAADEFKNLARFSFSGIEFPVESYTLRGSGRQHIHIYVHVSGGDPEKLGRNLYEVECRACFYTSDVKRLDIWPGRLGALRELFEAQVSGFLIIPSVGRINAFATAWDQEFTAKILNGEKATFRFLEDQSSEFLIDRVIDLKSKSVQSAAQRFVTLAQALRDQSPEQDQDLLDSIQDLANSVFAVRDQIELGGRLFGERVAMLAQLCAEAEKTVQFFKNPRNHLSLDALKDLWQASESFALTVAGQNAQQPAFSVAAANGSGASGRPHSGGGIGVTFQFYVVQAASMTISEVATAVYGSTERTMELLQLNAIEDAFVIPKGTQIRYIVPVE